MEDEETCGISEVPTKVPHLNSLIHFTHFIVFLNIFEGLSPDGHDEGEILIDCECAS